MKKNVTLLLLTGIMVCAQSCSRQANEKIVFVCEHGAARSTIASVYFNKRAREENLPYRSVFRGLDPDPVITTQTIAGLRRDGFETDELSTSLLTPHDTVSTFLMISLDCHLPSYYVTDHNWTGIPPISEDYPAARDEILRHVDELIIELKTKKH